MMTSECDFPKRLVLRRTTRNKNKSRRSYHQRRQTIEKEENNTDILLRVCVLFFLWCIFLYVRRSLKSRKNY